MMRTLMSAALLLSASLLGASPADAQNFFFPTGGPNGLIGTASRPESAGKIEKESADDFILTSPTFLNKATFTGLLANGAQLSDIQQVRVEIYRVFPKDSDLNRTINVPTRVNSPSDVAFATRETSSGNLSFTTNTLNSSFTVANSVINGINPKPNQTTGGEGPVTGTEVEFGINFDTPFSLPADHYFFIPQVELANGDFLWLSAPKPIVAPGTPFSPDLQSWIRDQNLDPDWLRIGTDIVGAGAFNASFSLTGQAVPEPGTVGLLVSSGFMALGLLQRKRRR